MRLSVSLTFLYREWDLEAAFAAAKADGFTGVEFQVTQGLDPARIARASQAANLPITLINVDLGDYVQGGAGLSGVPGREGAFEAAFKTACDLANHWECGFIHLGPSRVPDGMSREACRAVYLANIDMALAWRGASGTRARLLIEPMNRATAPDALINDIEVAADLITSTFPSDIGLLFDAYHVAMNGADPSDALRRHIALTRHIQFSDAPGRREPGTGSIDFPRFFATIRDLGYQGQVGCEYQPSGATRSSFGWMAQMAPIVSRR